MSKCDNCGTTILFGGVKEGEWRFCKAQCRDACHLMRLANEVPEHLIREEVASIHQGACPQCGGAGPVDVHFSHSVWSALVMTSWKSTPHVVCRRCGIRKNLGDGALSLVLGWWGFPWGLIVTPIQVVRNIVGIASGPDPSIPSAHLEKLVRHGIAIQYAQTLNEQMPVAKPV